MNASLQRILNVSSDKLSQLRGILLLIEVSLLASELIPTLKELLFIEIVVSIKFSPLCTAGFLFYPYIIALLRNYLFIFTIYLNAIS